MAATMLPLEPAIQRYLTELETSLRKTPGMSPDDGLADALEFLQSEWDAVQHESPPLAGELYAHFVNKFGTPEELAAEYAAACGLAGDSSGAAAADDCQTALKTRRGPATTWQPVLAGAALVVVLGVAALAWPIAEWAGVGRPSKLADIGPIWASRVVSFQPGNPQPTKSLDPQAALGEPDCRQGTRQAEAFVALGHGGELVLALEAAQLVDGEGPDLKIVEIGPLAEAVEVSVSSDGQNWLKIGIAKGADSTLDLAGLVRAGDHFCFLRLVDAGGASAVKNQWPGADIDAACALHAVGTR